MFSSVQFNSVALLCPALCNPMECSTRGFPVHHQLLRLAQTRVHQVSDVIQPSHPLSSPSPPAFQLSQHQGLFNESVLCIRWPKYWSFSFSICPSSEYSGLISFRMDWLDLLAVLFIIIKNNKSLSLDSGIYLPQEAVIPLLGPLKASHGPGGTQRGHG